MKYSTFILLTALMLSVVCSAGGCQFMSQPIPESQVSSTKAAIVADCIAVYFRADDAPYYTEQQHGYTPSAGYLKVVADEPTGTYTFTLTDYKFHSIKQKSPFLSDLPGSFMSSPLASLLFYSFTAGAGLLDTTQYTNTGAVKIEGRWYEAIQLPQSGQYHIALFRNAETDRIELVTIEDSQQSFKWMAQSYNLLYNKELNTLLPTKIDILNILKGQASKKLMIQFEYKTIAKQ